MKKKNTYYKLIMIAIINIFFSVMILSVVSTPVYLAILVISILVPVACAILSINNVFPLLFYQSYAMFTFTVFVLIAYVSTLHKLMHGILFYGFFVMSIGLFIIYFARKIHDINYKSYTRDFRKYILNESDYTYTFKDYYKGWRADIFKQHKPNRILEKIWNKSSGIISYIILGLLYVWPVSPFLLRGHPTILGIVGAISAYFACYFFGYIFCVEYANAHVLFQEQRRLRHKIRPVWE